MDLLNWALATPVHSPLDPPRPDLCLFQAKPDSWIDMKSPYLKKKSSQLIFQTPFKPN